jgi:hypothetical protein
MKGKKFFFLNFFGQKLLTWIFPKSFYGVFELPLLRNAQKRHKKIKKIKKKEGTMVPDLSSARYTSLSFFFSSAPLAKKEGHPAFPIPAVEAVP